MLGVNLVLLTDNKLDYDKIMKDKDYYRNDTAALLTMKKENNFQPLYNDGYYGSVVVFRAANY